MKEIEVKARVTNPSLLAEKLTQLEIQLSSPITQRDRVYFPKDAHIDFEAGIIRKEVKVPALRIREQDNEIIFTYKIPVSNSLDKIEYESRIENPEAMAHICEALGFVMRVKINKTRRKGKYKDYEICLDEVEGLGSYIEVEKISNENAEEVQKELWSLLLSLGIKEKDREYLGYDLLLERKKEH